MVIRKAVWLICLVAIMASLTSCGISEGEKDAESADRIEQNEAEEVMPEEETSQTETDDDQVDDGDAGETVSQAADGETAEGEADVEESMVEMVSLDKVYEELSEIEQAFWENTVSVEVPQALSQSGWTDQGNPYEYRPMITFYDDGTCLFAINQYEYMETVCATYRVYIGFNGTTVIRCSVEDMENVPSYFEKPYWCFVKTLSGEWTYYGDQAGCTMDYDYFSTDTEETISVQAASVSTYNAIIGFYCQALSEEWGAGLLDDAGLNYMCYWHDPETIGYTLMDINQDGLSELLVGEIASSEYNIGRIYDLYGIVDDEVVLVASSIERGMYYMCEDYQIAYEGSGGADYSLYYFLSYTGDEGLSFTDAVLYDGYYDKENPWFTCETATETEYGFDCATEDYQSVTETEALEIRNSHTYMELPYIPFASLN